MPLPLLHAAEAFVATSTLDARLAAVAVLAFAAAVALIWRPATSGRCWLARTGMWRRLGRRVALAMTVLALLQAALPYDHLLPGFHIDSEADARVHASHCHVDPGACSDMPLASGFGEFVFNEPLVTIPAMLAVAIFAAALVLRGSTPRPEVRPPQVAIGA